ncbi:MAG: hypothetical protein H7235_07995 [Bdellovibrionaceae bacterium]|nr:hypothetical protein [Pseudobdellovibrionaceae bacterium]
MNSFSVDVAETSADIKLTFHGSLSENSSMPVISTVNRPILIDMLDLKYINSYGIKLWCQWTLQQQSVKQIIFENCPFVFVKHITAVRGLWTSNMTMKSFFVPYYSDEAQERKDVLFTEGVHFTQQGVREIPQVQDSKGQPMELDVNKSTYFSFLK